MIQSMTAFARVEDKGEWGNAVCELRSINHRYLEISLHLPESLRVLEMPMRDRIKKALSRGKVDCSFRYQLSAGMKTSFTLNKDLALELCQASESISALLRSPLPIAPTEILRWQGVLGVPEVNLAAYEKEFFALLDRGLAELVTVRTREGVELVQLFLTRIELIQQELITIRKRLPEILAIEKELLIKRFKEASLQLNPERLEQEMLIYLQRIDIAEEIERTETHLTEVRRVLKEGGTVGRRLDFLLQELNREANTLGSKSVDSVTTHAAVEMKVLIEQIREQVQNIE